MSNEIGSAGSKTAAISPPSAPTESLPSADPHPGALEISSAFQPPRRPLIAQLNGTYSNPLQPVDSDADTTEHRLLLGILDGNAGVVRDVLKHSPQLDLSKRLTPNSTYTVAQLGAMTNNPEIVEPLLQAVQNNPLAGVADPSLHREELVSSMLKASLNVAVAYHWRPESMSVTDRQETTAARGDLKKNVPGPILDRLRKQIDVQVKAKTLEPNALQNQAAYLAASDTIYADSLPAEERAGALERLKSLQGR